MIANNIINHFDSLSDVNSKITIYLSADRIFKLRTYQKKAAGKITYATRLGNYVVIRAHNFAIANQKGYASNSSLKIFNGICNNLLFSVLVEILNEVNLSCECFFYCHQLRGANVTHFNENFSLSEFRDKFVLVHQTIFFSDINNKAELVKRKLVYHL